MDNQNAVEAAKQKIEDIKSAILSGDQKLTSQDLANARGELEFAELREKAAWTREQKRIEAESRERLSILEQRLSAVPKIESLEKFLLEIEKPLDRYLSKMQERNAEVKRIDEDLRDGGYIPGYGNYSPVEGITAATGTLTNGTTIGKTEARTFEPREKVERFVAEILQRHFPQRGR